VKQQLLPHLCIVSGPVTARDRVIGALGAAGLQARESDGHGLPSHPDPITAHANGAPNSGHTPGTPHPETLDFLIAEGDHDKGCTVSEKTGKPIKCEHIGQTETRPNPLTKHHGADYVEDPSVGFLAVECDDPDKVIGILADSGWMLRMHISPVLQTIEDELGPEARLARIEAELAALKAGR